MWNEIIDNNDLVKFMESIDFFHDSCVKELRYPSGAYVNEELSMYPVNDCRLLNVIIQRQSRENPMVEMEFKNLKYLRLYPIDCEPTCEILDSTMILKDGYIYWCDCGGLSEMDLSDYDGTIICASKLRWRFIDNAIGKKDFFLNQF